MADRLFALIEKRQRLIDSNNPFALRRMWIDSSIVFSATNDRLTMNVRSYFDRWRDRQDASGTIFEDRHVVPTWNLETKRNPVRARQKSSTSIPAPSPSKSRPQKA